MHMNWASLVLYFGNYMKTRTREIHMIKGRTLCYGPFILVLTPIFEHLLSNWMGLSMGIMVFCMPCTFHQD